MITYRLSNRPDGIVASEEALGAPTIAVTYASVGYANGLEATLRSFSGAILHRERLEGYGDVVFDSDHAKPNAGWRFVANADADPDTCPYCGETMDVAVNGDGKIEGRYCVNPACPGIDQAQNVANASTPEQRKAERRRNLERIDAETRAGVARSLGISPSGTDRRGLIDLIVEEEERQGHFVDGGPRMARLEETLAQNGISQRAVYESLAKSDLELYAVNRLGADAESVRRMRSEDLVEEILRIEEQGKGEASETIVIASDRDPPGKWPSPDWPTRMMIERAAERLGYEARFVRRSGRWHAELVTPRGTTSEEVDVSFVQTELLRSARWCEGFAALGVLDESYRRGAGDATGIARVFEAIS